MTRTHLSRTIAVRALMPLVAAALLTGCGSNFGAQTDQVYTPARGVSDRDGTVDVLNALIVSEEEGSGRLIAGLSNNDPETDSALTGVSAVGADATVQFAADGTAEIPAGGFVQLADPDEAYVAATGEGVRISGYVRLMMTFSEGEDVELNVPVVAPGQDFADVELTPAS